jgi:peptide/nickel transport system permease protein
MVDGLLRRLAGLLLTLAAASLIVFLLLSVLPGDPAAIILGIGAQEDTLRALRAQLGLDQPLAVQYLRWVAGLLVGDLGRSHTYGVPVAELVAQRAQVSLPLALMAMLLSTAIAIPAGVLAARARGRAVDVAVSGFAQLGLAIPNFWFAMLLILIFALTLKWLPAGGFPGWEAGLLPAMGALLLPALALALPQAAILARVTRSAVLDVMGEDYLRTARAKGLTRGEALLRHAVRNALVPVVTIMGLQFSFLIAGTIIIEQVCNLPGLGRLLFQAIAQRDLVTVRSLVMLLVATVIAVNFVVDLVYLLIDPRLRRPAQVTA